MDDLDLHVDGEELSARDAVCAGEDFVDLHAPLLLLQCGEDEEGNPVTVQALAIGEVQGKLLLALPAAAWHRKVAKRSVPRGFLTKVVAVEVAACLASDRGKDAEGQTVRIWVGLCEPAAESALTVSDEEPAVPFALLPSGEALFPFADALAALLHNQVAAGTSSAQTAQEGQAPAAEDPALADRLASLERSMAQLAASLPGSSGDPAASTRLGPGLGVKPSLVQPRSVLRKANPKAAPPSGLEYPGLDQGVVAAALSAGVETQVLSEMSRLVNSGPLNRLREKAPTARAKGPAEEPLDESEDEAAARGLDLQPGQAQNFPMPRATTPDPEPAEALAQALARCFDNLQGRAASSRASPLERALDASGSGTVEGSLGSGRRNAAARRALREALTTSPGELTQIIEALMSEDLAASTPGVGLPQVTSARGWLEHRSRVQAYPTAVHLTWAIAGALDCLRSGLHEQARARLNIALLQADQMSVDRGSWVLAQELSLELPPPLAAFKRHDAPWSSNDPVYSRLLDPRWAEIALGRLRDEADFLDKRQKLSQRRQLPNKDLSDSQAETPEKPPRKPPRKPAQ